MRKINKWKLMYYAGMIISLGAVMHWNGEVSLDILIIGLALMGTGYCEGKNEQRSKM